jgi:hypothetical protein
VEFTLVLSRSCGASWFGLELHHGLDFRRNVEWQLGDTDGRAGVASRIAPELDDEVAGSRRSRPEYG